MSVKGRKTQSGQLTVLMTGGGTGGHIYPGLAIIAEIRRLRPEAEFLWIGTRDRLEAKLVPAAGIDTEYIEVAFLKGKGLLGKLQALFQIPRALWQSHRHLRQFQPLVVVGVGGFASGPVALVAALKRIPTAILETNALPGLTNRLLGRFVKRVFVTFERTSAHFSAKKVRSFGAPIRPGLFATKETAEVREGDEVRLLVIGGSQGATTLNIYLPGLLQQVQERGIELEVRHSAGSGRVDEVTEAYGEANFVDIHEYIDDMAAAYTWADLVICRSGASTVAELAVVGLGALFIPFPGAADNHQEKNARAVVEDGGGVLMLDSELREEPPLDRLTELLGDRAGIREMGRAAAKLGRPEAGRRIAEEIVALTED